MPTQQWSGLPALWLSTDVITDCDLLLRRRRPHSIYCDSFWLSSRRSLWIAFLYQLFFERVRALSLFTAPISCSDFEIITHGFCCWPLILPMLCNASCERLACTLSVYEVDRHGRRDRRRLAHSRASVLLSFLILHCYRDSFLNSTDLRV